MDLTHVTASVVGGQQYPRPGHSDIYHGRTRHEGVFRGSCLNNHQTSRIKVKQKQKNLFTEELQDIALQSKVSLISRKKIPEECNKGKFGFCHRGLKFKLTPRLRKETI